MGKKWVAVLVVLVALLAASGVYLGVHRSKSAGDSSHPASTVVAKKTTYQATVSNSVFTTKSSSALGRYLTTPAGKALYTYAKDKNGVSNCTASCIADWPAYKDTHEPGTGLPTNVGTTTRADDNTVQYTYKGLPLYTYSRDANGNVKGNNVSGFKLVRL